MPFLPPTVPQPRFPGQLARLDRRRLVRNGLMLAGLPTLDMASGRRAGAAPRRQLGFKGGDGTMIVAIAGDPVSLNPGLVLDPNAALAVANIFSRLVMLDAEGNLLPDLAERWEISDDGLRYTFALDRTATWHDGEPVTAADVQFTLEQILATADAPARERLSPITAIETPNDMTVILTLEHPSASLLAALGDVGTFILPAHIYQGSDWTAHPANMDPVGSGPFRFLSYTPGATIDLETFYDYFGQGPHLDRLLLQVMPDPGRAANALRHGEIDLITTPLPAPELASLRQTTGIAVDQRELPSIAWLGFNLRQRPLSDAAVRLAIAQAIDRDQLVGAAMDGLGASATAFLPAALAWAADETVEHLVPSPDPDAAAASLDEAGFPADGEARFPVELLVDASTESHVRLGAILREQLSAIGIRVEVTALDRPTLDARLQAGDFDMTLIDGPSLPDPAGLRDLVGGDGRDNSWSYRNDGLDALFAEGEAVIEHSVRAEIYAQIQELLAHDLPILPLVSPVAAYPHTARASGFGFSVTSGATSIASGDATGVDQFSQVRLTPTDL